VLLADAARSGGAQSHVGRAAHLVLTGGTEEAWKIIGRKLAMNALLIQHSPWSRLLTVCVLGAAAMLWNSGGGALKRMRGNPQVHGGAIAAAVAALAALLFNDSGVLAAAAAFIYVWSAVAVAAFSGQTGINKSDAP
jgi:sterol desaturase/sphingolipid hydroxylase (fatty acid hydroxylase superfamily)